VRLATNENWTDKQGQKQERTEWHSVVLWGKPAEIVKQYVTKGQKLYVEGRLQTRSWDDKDGKKRYMTEIVAQDFMFLSGRGEGGASGGEFGGGGGGAPGGGGGAGGWESPPPADDFNQAPRGGGPGDDDIPF
jgi:single-strand DNA-binding protein